jgi:EF hand
MYQEGFPMKVASVRTLFALALAVAVASAYSTPASAADQPRCTSGTANTLDVEGGGRLAAGAHRASAAKRFELMDANKDGKVTADEIGASRGAESIAWASRMASPREKIAELDTNRDGALTAKEYADSSQRVFVKLDLDGDGVLSDAEMLMPTRGRSR